MKLVDILASELKHWPSTRTAAVGQSNSGSLHLNEEPRHGSDFFGWTTCKFTMAEDCQSAWVTRDEWQAAVDSLNAPKVVEWDGERQSTDGNDLRNQALKDLEYNPETGVLIWRKNKQKRFIGREAGSVNHHGYRRMHILNTRIDAHRLVWLMHYGYLPGGEVDHINGNKLDNRLVNLRMADQQKNQQNVGVRADSRLGVKGVRIRPSGKYQARVSLTDGSKLVKTFECLDSAVAWLSAARKESHGEFARDSAEQVAAEERMAAAYGMCAIAPSLSNVDAIALYDASYRKQVLK